MRVPKIGCWLIVPAALVLANRTALADPPVEVKVVKFAGLDETVKKFQGKVIVMDFWADT